MNLDLVAIIVDDSGSIWSRISTTPIGECWRPVSGSTVNRGVESHGRVVVFSDVSGNKWDLLG